MFYALLAETALDVGRSKHTIAACRLASSLGRARRRTCWGL